MQIAQIKPEHRSVDLEFNHAKEHFSKLKFSFIELETKLQFLEHLEVCAKNIQELSNTKQRRSYLRTLIHTCGRSYVYIRIHIYIYRTYMELADFPMVNSHI